MNTQTVAGLNPVPVPGSAWSGDPVRYLDGEKPLHDYLFDHADTVPDHSCPQIAGL